MAILPLREDAALVLLRHFVTAEAKRADRPPPALDDDLGREIVELVGASRSSSRSPSGDPIPV